MHLQYQTTATELTTLLDCLRAVRKAGVELVIYREDPECSDDSSKKFWHGLIERTTLDAYIYHRYDEVSDVLGGVDSHS